MLLVTLLPALILLGAGAWAVSTSLGLAGALGPWEEVAASGRTAMQLAEPTADPALSDALEAHRGQLSASLTQARRWAFLGDRFRDALPWLALGMAIVLAVLAAAASRRLARELARPIQDLVVLADRMGRGEALPPASGRPVREVAVLDHALRAAATELAAAQQRAIAAERLRVWGEMARRVAHEMKNPLTPLRLAAHRLARADCGGASEGVAEVAEVVDQEVRRLEELAAQFSALGRPTEGPRTDVDVGDMLRSLIETDVPPGTSAELTVDTDLPVVHAHYDALVRAFRNLIRNAVEATADVADARLQVAVRAAAAAEGTAGAGGWLEVQVEDNGSGLPPGQADRVFEPDFTTKTRGTGLGLALVRQAVEADGGTIEAGQAEGGAVFLIRLPLATAPGAADPERNEHETSVR